MDCHLRKVLCKILEDIWETVRDLCPEMHKPLEWQGQDEPWNSPKWRQQSLQGAIVADVGEAYDVANAALPVFGKVLKEVSQRFHFSRAYFISGDLEIWHSDLVSADRVDHSSCTKCISRAVFRAEIIPQ